MPVSAHKRIGLDELRAALRTEAQALPRRSADEPFRLPVDRVFTMPGAGVVVTGTCWSGRRRASATSSWSTRRGLKVRVREVQAHGRVRRLGGAGQRLALALHGVKRDDLERGYQVLAPGRRRRHAAARPAGRPLSPTTDGALKNRQRLHVHHAGREVLGRIVLLDCRRAGRRRRRARALCQLHLEEPLVAAPRRPAGAAFLLAGDVASPAGRSSTPRRGGTGASDEVPRAARRDGERRSRRAVPPELRSAGLAGARRRGRVRRAHRRPCGAVPVGRRALRSRAARRELRGRPSASWCQEYAAEVPAAAGLAARGGTAPMPLRAARRPSGTPLLPGARAARAGWTVVGDRIAASPEGPPCTPSLRRRVAGARGALRGLTAWMARAGRFTEAGPMSAGGLPAGQKDEEVPAPPRRSWPCGARSPLITLSIARRWPTCSARLRRVLRATSRRLDLRPVPRAERPDPQARASRCSNTWTRRA